MASTFGLFRKNFLIGIFGCFLLPFNGFAQVATPSLDPSEFVSMPAASGWRETTTASISYKEGNGTRTLQDQQIYQFDTSGVAGNLAFQSDNFFMEINLDQNTTSVKLEKYYNGQINLSKDDARLHLALIGDDFVSIGLGGRSVTTKDYIDATHDSESTTRISTIGAISVKAMDVFYFGLGFERIKEESTYASNITWNNIVSGVAIKLGDLGGTRFRFEYDLEFSSEVEVDAQGDLESSRHPKTSVSTAIAEIMFNGLLFSAKNKEAVIDIDHSDVSEVKKTTTQGGVLWKPEQGLSLGFYFITYKTVSFYVDDNSLFQINLGYIF